MRALYIKDLDKYHAGEKFSYCGDYFHHLKNVIRLRPGEKVLLLNGEGLIAESICVDIGKKSALFQVRLKALKKRNGRECIISQIKKESMELALRAAVETGVESIQIVKTDYSQNFKINVERLEKLLISSMLQANSPFLPKVVFHNSFEDFIKKFKRKILFFDNSIVNNSQNLEIDNYLKMSPVIMIGPEGGFSKKEKEIISKNNYVSLAFDSPIMRAENALVAALSFRYFNL